MNSKLILVGGFLGAGKTTFLYEAAKQFTEKGEQVGLITNDQASALVDTSFLSRSQARVREVSGSCFCCNYSGFTAAVNQLKQEGATVIIAEPVGSCTDLSATIMQPLKDTSEGLDICPLTVLADPGKLTSLLAGGHAGLHESAAYIVKKQLEEADIIVIHKSDTLSHEEQIKLIAQTERAYPGKSILSASALAGSGLDIWTDVIANEKSAGRQIVDVDYDVYAEGEAVLGWLNTTCDVKGGIPDFSEFTRSLLDKLASRFAEESLAVGHVKTILEADDQFTLGNLTSGPESISVRGTGSAENSCVLTVNARVETEADHLKALVGEVLRQELSAPLSFEITVSNCLTPGRPNPTHRYSHIV